MRKFLFERLINIVIPAAIFGGWHLLGRAGIDIHVGIPIILGIIVWIALVFLQSGRRRR